MKKILWLLLAAASAFSSDNISIPPSGGTAYLTDNQGLIYPAQVIYTTDGNGKILTAGGLLVADNLSIPPSSGNLFLTDNLGRFLPAIVTYTTDGNGNVIPLPFGGGGGVSSVTGTAPVVSSGGSTPAISMAAATSSSDGYLIQADWNTFNSKQPAGNYITALTGDATGSGPDSAVLTFATVNSNVGSFGSASYVGGFTVNGKGLVTAASSTPIQIVESQVTNLVSDLAAKQPNLTFTAPLVNTANTVTSSIFTGDTGTGGLSGIVPAPPAGKAESQSYLSASGSFVAPDQSKPRYVPFSMISQTSSPDPGAATKYENVVISGTHAYAIGGASAPGLTLSIFNIANQAAPVAEGYLTTGSVVWNSGPPYFLNGGYNLAVNGTHAFICSSGSSVIYVVDVSNPNSPFNSGKLTVPGSPGSLYDCIYQAGYVYIATQNAGLDVVDVGGGACSGTITTPTNCFQEGGSVKSFGVAFSGSTLYTTQYTTSGFTTRQIKSWNISTPQTPTLIQSLQVTTAGEALGISVYGNTAYVSVSATGVNAYDVIDVTTPSAMTNLSVITPSAKMNSAFAAVQDGNYAFFPSGSSATYGGAIDMYDMTNRSLPKYVSTAYTNVPNSVFGGIALDGKGYIYSADYGPNSGSTGTLDIFTEPTLSSVVGKEVAGTLSVSGLLSLPVQGSGVSPLSPTSGSLGLTSAFILCVYNGTSWVKTADGTTACTF